MFKAGAMSRSAQDRTSRNLKQFKSVAGACKRSCRRPAVQALADEYRRDDCGHADETAYGEGDAVGARRLLRYLGRMRS